MGTRRVLWLTSAFGLGHIFRDIAIADALRHVDRDVSVEWLVAASLHHVLKERGETIHSEGRNLRSGSDLIERATRGYGISMWSLMRRFPRFARHNAAVFLRVARGSQYDLIVGDEAWEIGIGFRLWAASKSAPFAFLTDYLKFRAERGRWVQALLLWPANAMMVRSHGRRRGRPDCSVLVGDEEDVPDERFGAFLPNVREWARRYFVSGGPVLPFRPEAIPPRAVLRGNLGYAEDAKVVVAAVGGTSIGRRLVEMCLAAFPSLVRRIPNAHLVVVCGPRLDPTVFQAPASVMIRGYVPRLWEHYAACDAAVIQAGLSSGLELSALKRPFLFVPLEGHFEQQHDVPRALARYGAGRRLDMRALRPERLAEAIADLIEHPPAMRDVPTDGAEKAARLLHDLMLRKR